MAVEPIARGHKIALRSLAEGEAVLKFGVRIGHASRAIAAGEWVHLQNLASDHDERSASLDLHTGAPTDTVSAYE
jgi:altronate hydrolase/altronate dehydratase small subunit